MAENISFKDFMDQVEKRLKAYSPEILQGIIMEWAKNTHPSKRIEFLSKLVPASPVIETSEPDEGLLEEINELAVQVENGSFCTGWGWDDAIHEERDWGDESWADEADEFFSRAYEALKAGDYRLARDAYARLFDILDMDQEPGHLPGPPDPQDLLDTDLYEARASYLRSVYLSFPLRERPNEMQQAMQRFKYQIGDKLNLQSVVNIERNPLPEFSQFLLVWIDLLKKSNERSASFLLREAMMLSGGTSAIARLAHEEGNHYPRAYVDWIKALEKDGDIQSMLEAAKEGLANIPRDYTVRAEIAEGMVRAADRLHDIDIQLVGWHEAFYSDPSLSYLLSLLSVADQKTRYKEEIEAAINRLTELLEKQKKSRSLSRIVNSELQESAASLGLLNQAYLLAGRYEGAFNLCKNKEATGWIYERNPEALVIPFFMVLLSKREKIDTAPNLEQLWKESLNNSIDSGLDYHNVADNLEKSMDKVMRSILLTEEEENKYLRWCVEKTGSEVDATVGAKDRYHYSKAATQLVALAEVLAIRNRKSNGLETIEKYRQKYSHYSAFRKELSAALERSSILH